MAKDGEAVSVIKKKASGTIFLMLARPQGRVEMGKVRETLRGALDFAYWAHCREKATAERCVLSFQL